MDGRIRSKLNLVLALLIAEVIIATAIILIFMKQGTIYALIINNVIVILIFVAYLIWIKTHRKYEEMYRSGLRGQE